MKTLSQCLTEKRVEKGISQADLSKLAGIELAHIERIETGKSKPTMPLVFRICKALQIDPLTLADSLTQEFHRYKTANFPKKKEFTAS